MDAEKVNHTEVVDGALREASSLAQVRLARAPTRAAASRRDGEPQVAPPRLRYRDGPRSVTPNSPPARR